MADRLVIAFDLVGTLLDLAALDPAFQSTFGDPRVRHEWFSELLKVAFATTAAGGYESFSDVADAALEIIEEKHNQTLSATQHKEIRASLRRLPAFPDVQPGLEPLQSSGYRLVILTNSGQKAAKEAIEPPILRAFSTGSSLSKTSNDLSLRRNPTAWQPRNLVVRQVRSFWLQPIPGTSGEPCTRDVTHASCVDRGRF